MKTHIVNLDAEALPRCFILDERRRVIITYKAEPGRPLEPQILPDDAPAALPAVLERAVTIVTDHCRSRHLTSKVVRLGTYQVTVQLLRGSRRNHTAVTVERAA